MILDAFSPSKKEYQEENTKGKIRGIRTKCKPEPQVECVQ
jgi:hypothetical protein